MSAQALYNAARAAAEEAPRIPQQLGDTMASSLPSLRTVSKLALGGAQVLLGAGSSAHAGTSKSCSADGALSCQNTTVQTDLCCFNAPGGQLLMTQFWDTQPVTGPVDSWTMHGLWPDRCDGTYEASCDSSRAYTNITEILESFNAKDTLSYMQTYWKDYNGNDETFWEHEWSKHGTCISTLKPSCYTDYDPTQEVPDFFDRAVALFKALPTYEWLSAAGITPSTSKTYTSAEIQAALKAKHGQEVTIGCKSGAFNEVWYHYNVRGSVQSGDFVAAEPDGTKSTCPSSGVKYIPKSSGGGGTTTTATGTATKTSTTAVPTSTGSFSGKGNLMVQVNGAQNGCIISAGAWYTTGTCATFTASASGDGFTLSSSKGKCGIADGELTCGSGVSDATVFTAADGKLAYEDSTAFYADTVPSGTTKGVVYTSDHDVAIAITWTSA
ncbi:Ribonuclease T2 [Lasiodiplodia theobromae]|uniref:Ribonuclease T2-like n=1 Tax=Lasiodiplodia theobromae TaxID=45133 RepID=A0A5N5D5E6_9PEZI|nr:Ribonuclease m [Lasiodiplodia theobromae]KAB2572817.1 Ribonuclease T2-like [Lasiodiplodia theobromae]KAF4537567.1 Ribonuclease m [Lasiodiplodia theobromae]KAF9639464.1 Ribonuclease T2 [Lasiodiplodia theobromae]